MTNRPEDHATEDHAKEESNDTMSKLVGALILELADDVPDKPGLETVRADLFAASKVYENGKKKDLALRFYLAIRSLLQEVDRLEKAENTQHVSQDNQQQGSNQNQYAQQQHDGQYRSTGSIRNNRDPYRSS